MQNSISICVSASKIYSIIMCSDHHDLSSISNHLKKNKTIQKSKILFI